MKKSDLHSRRLLLENPYAHLEQLEVSRPKTVSEAVRASRKRLENPYAYLGGDDELSALDQPRASRRSPHSFEQIEQVVTELQRRLWNNRHELWEGASPSPVEVLDVIKAAKLVGFEMEVVDSLGIFVDRAEKVAGLIDRSKNSILVSRDFSPSIQSFTAAHELGHAILHAHLDVVHRDRPVDGVLLGRDRIELEADKFAACFLMPAKLVRAEFVSRFLADKFSINEDTAYALAVPLESAQRDLKSKRSLARVLASATYYNGRNFYSLAEQFNVTVGAMAIRLEELQLV